MQAVIAIPKFIALMNEQARKSWRLWLGGLRVE
jgi:hypothetical protein